MLKRCNYICTSKLEYLQNKIRVGAVSYLNTKPLLYGFNHGFTMPEMELVEDYPAHIASMLLNDEIDVGLVPVAIIPKLKAYHIISDFCIGATAEVASVCIFSEVPLKEIKKLILDYQSRTSVVLAKILLEKYWKLDVEFVESKADFRNEIKDTTAAVVIGDRAFKQRQISRYHYDLAAAWIDFTGLPFVFAAWVANKKLPDTFIHQFNAANKFGLSKLEEVVSENPYQYYDLKTYYTKNISYNLDELKRNGLEKFLNYLKIS